MTITESLIQDSRKRFVTLCAAMLLVSLVYHGLGLRTFIHWWFEDDAGLFAYVHDFANPLRFFWDHNALKQFRGAVPMQSLSLWIDSALAYRSILFAHLHQVFSLAVTLILLFHVLRGFGLSGREAFAICLVWLCLPAVVVVNEFLSARHYLEGFAWSLGGVLVAQQIGQGKWRESFLTEALLFATLAGAALCKELYVITLPLFVALYLSSRRKYHAATVAIAIVPLYTVYRYWAIGSDSTYEAPFLDFWGYLQFLGRVPYIFAGNAGGYVLMAVAAFLFLYHLRQVNVRIAGNILVVLASALVTIYPVTFAISRDWLLHGTWYRVMFFLSSLILLGSGYWICRRQTVRLRAMALLICAIILGYGAYLTQRHWHHEMLRYECEGRYYLQHEDRLVYSELPASWYLDGIASLYGVGTRHHIPFAQRQRLSPEQAATYQTIWRYRNGSFVEDRQLYHTLLGK
jgi:hypothetical protein